MGSAHHFEAASPATARERLISPILELGSQSSSGSWANLFLPLTSCLIKVFFLNNQPSGLGERLVRFDCRQLETCRLQRAFPAACGGAG